MNLFVLASLFASLASAKFKIEDSSSEGCSLISSSDSVSSSYLPYYDDRTICTRALEAILAHPNEVAYKYFAPMEKAVRMQSLLWFNPSTRSSTAENFSSRYGVLVYLSDASGAFVYEQVALDPAFQYDQFTSTARSWALNAGVASTTGNGQVWYSFPIFDAFGNMLTVSLVQTTANMPLNQICYKQVRRY